MSVISSSYEEQNYHINGMAFIIPLVNLKYGNNCVRRDTVKCVDDSSLA